MIRLGIVWLQAGNLNLQNLRRETRPGEKGPGVAAARHRTPDQTTDDRVTTATVLGSLWIDSRGIEHWNGRSRAIRDWRPSPHRVRWLVSRVLDLENAHAHIAEKISFPPRAAERGRRGFYVAECVILGLNTTCCIIGLLVSVSYYGAVSATPGRIAKVGFMLETSGALMFLQAIWFLCVMFLILSVPIVAAKASAVAFVCAVAVSLLSVGISFYIMHKCWRVQLNIFRDEARALMGGAEEEKRQENGEEGGAVADSTEKQVEG